MWCLAATLRSVAAVRQVHRWTGASCRADNRVRECVHRRGLGRSLTVGRRAARCGQWPADELRAGSCDCEVRSAPAWLA